jgi:hypothetical protein
MATMAPPPPSMKSWQNMTRNSDTLAKKNQQIAGVSAHHVDAPAGKKNK